MPRKASAATRTSEKGIRRTPTGRYLARFLGPDSRQHSKTFDTLRQAREWRDEERRKMLVGGWAAPRLGKMTLAEWGGQWLASVPVEVGTLTNYEGVWRVHIKPRWGSVQLANIGQQDLRAWLAGIRKADDEPLSAARLRHIAGVLSQMLDAAVVEGRLSRNPARELTGKRAKLIPRGQRTKPHRFLAHHEVARLAAAVPPEYAALVRVLAYTGLRWGEATALQVKSYDALRGRLSVNRAAKEPRGQVIYGPTKTHASREVVVPKHLRAEVSALQDGKGPDDLLFTTKDGNILRHSNFDRRVFRPAVKAAGLASLTKHDLRHTAASLAISSGANVKVVQRMLGHKTATLTLDLYAGLFEDDLDDVADRLADAAKEAQAGAHLQSICSLNEGRVS